MTYLILFWVVGVALLDFGLIGAMLTWKLEPRLVFLIAAANPVEAARLALLSAPATTSARRYRARGTLRTFARNALALAAWRLGVDRERVASWYRA